MPVAKGRRMTPRNFIPRDRLNAYKWHNRTEDTSLPSRHMMNPPRSYSIDTYHPGDRDRSKNTDIQEISRDTPRWGKDGDEVPAYHPLNFDPANMNRDVIHTAPYFTTIIRREIDPISSNPEKRNMTACRPYVPGSLYDTLAVTAPVWTSIPKYTGHIRGKYAEDVSFVGYTSANEAAQAAIDKRRKPSDNEWRQSSSSFTIRCPRGTWQDIAYNRWKQDTHGLTQQNREPFGKGTEYRATLKMSEQLRRKESDDRYARATTQWETWAANKPSDVRPCRPWRKGIRGHGGHHPLWKEDKDMFEKMEVGKIHPPYCPEVTHYSCIAPAPRTPRDLDIKGAKKWAEQGIYRERAFGKTR